MIAKYATALQTAIAIVFTMSPLSFRGDASPASRRRRTSAPGTNQSHLNGSRDL